MPVAPKKSDLNENLNHPSNEISHSTFVRDEKPENTIDTTGLPNRGGDDN